MLKNHSSKNMCLIANPETGYTLLFIIDAMFKSCFYSLTAAHVFGLNMVHSCKRFYNFVLFIVCLRKL